MKIDIKELCNALGVEYDSAKSSAFYLHMVKEYRSRYNAAQQSVQSDVLEWCGCEGFTPTMENGKCSACGKNAHR
jgi:hypothetical protein